MFIDSIQHVQLAMPAGGEDRAREFFGNVLAMTEVSKPQALAGRGGCWFRAGSVNLHLGVDEDFAPARKAHPAFVVFDIDDLRRVLADYGVICRDDEPIDGFRRFFAEDPFGNRIEFMQAGT